MEIIIYLTLLGIIVYSLYKIFTFGPNNPIVEHMVLGYLEKYPKLSPDQIYKLIFVKYYLTLLIGTCSLIFLVLCL